MDAIKLTFEGKSYELTYTRETVKQMENTGFDIQMLAHQPTVQGDKMFAGAFLAKCKGVKRKVIDDIWTISQKVKKHGARFLKN